MRKRGPQMTNEDCLFWEYVQFMGHWVCENKYGLVEGDHAADAQSPAVAELPDEGGHFFPGIC